MESQRAVGFVGLGVMGAPMAQNLVGADFDVIVYNRSPEPVAAAVAAGARAAESVRHLTESTDVVVTMLSNDAAVREVVLGPAGVLASASPGMVLIDMSTVTPALARELAETAASRGVAVLDAPVSGGDAGARDGTLSIMVGGDATVLDGVRDVLEAMGSSIAHVGTHGAGQATKAANQLLVGVILAGIAEALTLGTRLGVKPATLLDVLSRGSAANRILELRRQNLLSRVYTPGFKAALHHKDLTIVRVSADAHGIPLPLTETVRGMLGELIDRGDGDLDHSALVAIVESHAQPSIAAHDSA